MNYNNLRIGSVAFLAALLLNGCGPRRGDRVLQSWETSNQSFKVRIRQFNEKPMFLPGLPGYYFAFETADHDRPDQWREVATIRTDDDVKIPREQVRFVNDSIGYFFMGQIYAVTIDGGHLWSVWNAAKEREPEAFIKDVRIDQDGTGEMSFYPNPKQGTQPANLFTNDYGQHWQPK